jgi:UDP-N-acetylmuramoylalanine--D-glutamate ligase
MDLKGKSVLVVGLARSGISAAKLLDRLGARVIVSDRKNEAEIPNIVKELKQSTGCSFFLGNDPDELIDRVDLIVISPGVPVDSPFVIKAKEKGKEVISEVELAYRFCKAPIIAITGTNGKTTTTALTGEILKAFGKTTHVVGNIGIPFTAMVPEIREDDTVVAEISSFQLETIVDFKPVISMILNITEDHLNRHKTMENYIAAKARVFENQDSSGYLILNGDDEILNRLELDTHAQVLYFSRKRILTKGAWVENGAIVMNLGDGPVQICSTEEIFIPGAHNLENSLAAVLAAGILGVTPGIIAGVLKEFAGVEHRIEKVAVIDGVTFFNDSKGTNPDSSIKAIEAMTGPTVLIAGGMDKKSSFETFVDAFGDKIKALVLLGETADIIAQTAKDKGFTNIYYTKTIQEATEKSFELSSPGYNVLLSPACASWDMFRDYEERGKVFKEAVRALRR